MANDSDFLVSDFFIDGLRQVDVNEAGDCPVCYEPLSGTQALQTLDCPHIFCRGCTLQWCLKEGRNTCPLCREQLYRLADTVTLDKYGDSVKSMDKVVGNIKATFFHWNAQHALDDTWFRAFARHRLLARPWVEFDLITNGIELLFNRDIDDLYWPVSTFGLIQIPEALPEIDTLATLSNVADDFIKDRLRQKKAIVARRPAIIPPYDSMVAVLLVIGNLIPVFNNWRYTCEVTNTKITVSIREEGAKREAAWAKMMRRLAAWCKRHQGSIFYLEDDPQGNITYDVYDEMLDEAWSGETLLEGERAYSCPVRPSAWISRRRLCSW